MPFIPHTTDDIQAMLSALSLSSLDELFSEVPANLLLVEAPETLPAALSEQALKRLMRERAKKDECQLCFNGAGAYLHHIPSAVWAITKRGEFMTAYTPYQAEASQGSLQLIYEYQSMLTQLLGTEVANASLYDGASALAEAVLMAIRLQKKAKPIIFMPDTVHPAYREVVKTLTQGQAVILRSLPYHPETGCVDEQACQRLFEAEGGGAALVIPQPNFLGQLEHVDQLTDLAHAAGMLVIAVVNPLAMALLKPPGDWGQAGADIICGEGQPLGLPLNAGGPYLGFMAAKLAHVRQMPGRIVGRTRDRHGLPGFTLTLQAREQHIRRAKATSNICTNQGLAVTAATIYMALLGGKGLKAVALSSHQMTVRFVTLMKEYCHLTPLFSVNYFHEVVFSLPSPSTAFIHEMRRLGIEPGVDIQSDYPDLKNPLLVCVTELKTEEDLLFYAKTAQTVLKRLGG